jgi:hypothetical protein
MYKKKKLAQKKHRKNKVRLKALKVASLSKSKPKKKIVSSPIKVEKKAEVKEPVAKKVAVKKAPAKKPAAKKPAAKKPAAKKPAAKKPAAKKPVTKAKAKK